MDNVSLLWWALEHSASAISILFALMVVMRARADRRPPGSMWAWVLVILFVPYIGALMFVLFAGRKIRSRHSVNLGRTSHAEFATSAESLFAQQFPPAQSTNSLSLLSTGDAAFDAFMHLISTARSSIDVSTFVLGNDVTGHSVLDGLMACVERGVRVRVLLDTVGCLRAPKARLKRLQAMGGQVSWFMPVFRLSLTGHANLRNHRKIFVVDDRVAIVGGMNLAEEYMGPTPRPSQWKDLSVRIEGPSVADIANLFESDWSLSTGQKPTLHEPGEVTGSARLQFVAAGPDQIADSIYDATLTAIYEARRRVWITTPYFIPDEGLFHALLLAARRGVDVCLIIPAHSNHRLADVARATYVRDLYEHGVRFEWFEPQMLHAKCMVFDDSLAVLGSANLDIRSLFLNFEAATFIYDAESVALMSSWFDEVFQSCTQDSPLRDGLFWQFWEGMARLISPLL